MTIAAVATVTSRGQVTLPRAVRDVLGDSKSIEFSVDGNVITLQAVPDMSDSLSKIRKGQIEGTAQ